MNISSHHNDLIPPLEHRSFRDLVRVEPAALLAAFEGAMPWTEGSAEVLDQVLRHRVARLFESHASLEDVEALSEALRRILHPRWTSREGMPRCHPRWSCLLDLLEQRLSLLREGDLGRVLAREHVRPLLELVIRHSPGSQQELRDRYNQGNAGKELRDANLIRVLDLMETNGLVVRQRIGRRKAILPGARAEEALGLAGGGDAEGPRDRYGSGGALEDVDLLGVFATDSAA